MIFGELELLEKATMTNLLSIDGTFSSCPKTHKQLLTIHVITESGFSFPVLFCLLSGKS